MNHEEVIFTICITTFNRGKKALNLIKTILPYMKNGWEILLLNNNSDSEVEFYDEIKNLSLQNKYLRYIQHKNNILFHGNFLACFEKSNSQYNMILSDEDFPNMNLIEDTVNYLLQNSTIGILRGSIQPIEGVEPGNSFWAENTYMKAGEEAVLNHAFSNNYHSGTIYNVKKFKEYGFIALLKKNIHVHFIYPQLYLELLVCTKLDAVRIDNILSFEGSSQIIIENGAIVGSSSHYKMPYSFGSRIDQFVVLKDAVKETCNLLSNPLDAMFYTKLYMKLVNKYFYLISKVNMPLYEKTDLENKFLIKSFYNVACSAIVADPLLENFKDDIIELIDNTYSYYKIG